MLHPRLSLLMLAIYTHMQLPRSFGLLKSPNDPRHYSPHVLPNELKLLFIEDPTAEKCACSISVGAGSLHDPPTALGLAHFLEHMLFMGSLKFPRQNQYSEFISSNSGADNAYTADEETNYYFQIGSNHFREAVQRLTNFFVSPLLTPSAIEKERQAVHEEFKLRGGEDNSRKWQILKDIARGPYAQFNYGNQDTLSSPDIRDQLVRFYETYYSSNIMTAVILGNRPIAEMESELIPFFLQIPNRQVPKTTYDVPFKTEDISKLIHMQAIKDEAIMECFWMVQNIRPFYKQHLSSYYGHVFGHQGTNSLLSILKKEDYASQITSYHHELMSQTILGLEIHLTEQGEKDYQKVYNIVTDYTASLSAEPYIYAEIKEIHQLEFIFLEKTRNDQYVVDLSSKMHLFPFEEILTHDTNFDPFDPKIMNKFLREINPFNLVIVYSNSEEIQHTQTEKYFGTKYSVRSLPERINTKLAFKSIGRNPFLPISTCLISNEVSHAPLYAPTKMENLYFLQDTSFKVCKGGASLKIHSQESFQFREFYSAYLQHLLKHISYNADLLNLQFEINHEDSLELTFSGFTDTIYKLLHEISKVIKTAHKGQSGEALFSLTLDHLIEDYENFLKGDVSNIAMRLLDNTVLRNANSLEQSTAILNGFKYKKISQRIDNFWKKCSFEWIFVGNFDLQQSVAAAKRFQGLIGSEKSAAPQQNAVLKVAQIAKIVTWLEPEEIDTSACIVQFEVGPYENKLYYMALLLKDYIKEPFFDTLRTQRQMAYHLQAYTSRMKGVITLSFILISSGSDPEQISTEIHKFVNNFYSAAQTELTQAKLNGLKESLKTEIGAPLNNVNELFEFVRREVNEKTFYFNRKSKAEIESQLSPITKADLLNLAGSITKRALEIYVVAKNHAKGYSQRKVEGVVSADELKKSSQYYAEFKNEFKA